MGVRPRPRSAAITQTFDLAGDGARKCFTQPRIKRLPQFSGQCDERAVHRRLQPFAQHARDLVGQHRLQFAQNRVAA